MIQGFVKQSGGSVQVYSEPNIGTTFKIYFKAIEKGESGISELISQPQESVDFFGAKVLLAEDEIEVLKIVQRTLEGMGCVVKAVASGDEALELLQQNSDFDLLVTDIVMPGELMGTHLAKAARLIKPELPVIFMSGYADEAQVHGNGLRRDARSQRFRRLADGKSTMQPSVVGGQRHWFACVPSPDFIR